MEQPRLSMQQARRQTGRALPAEIVFLTDRGLQDLLFNVADYPAAFIRSQLNLMAHLTSYRRCQQREMSQGENRGNPGRIW